MRRIKEIEITSVCEYIQTIYDIPNYINKYFNNDKLFKIFDEIEKFSLDQKTFKKDAAWLSRKEKQEQEKQLKEKLYDIIKYLNEIPILDSFIQKLYLKEINKNKEEDYFDFRKGIIEYYYRGVYDGENFNLLPSCFRKNNYGKENLLYQYIRAKCFGDLHNKNHLDTLVTLQHYDCPTRLLDITSNPLVALYFACKNYGCNNCDVANFGYVYVFANEKSKLLFSDSDKAIMLSCLAKFTKEEQIKIHDECIKLILNEGLDAIFDSYTKNKVINKLYHEISTEVNFEKRIRARDLLMTYFVQANTSNKRIDKQSGAFIICGVSKDPIEVEDKIKSNIFYKIKVKNQVKILEELDLLNINEASLFPELDKVSRYFVSKITI